MWSGKRLLAVLVCARHGQGFISESLVFLQHSIQLVLEMAYLHLASVQALVAGLHHAYDLGEVLLSGGSILCGCVGSWRQLAGEGQ